MILNKYWHWIDYEIYFRNIRDMIVSTFCSLQIWLNLKIQARHVETCTG